MPSIGRYCNGDPFVKNLAAGPGVKFTSITPASANPSGRKTNGAMLDFGEAGGASGPTTQGLDGYVPAAGLYITYDNALNVDPGNTGAALQFAAGTEGTILKAVAKTTPEPTENGRDRVDYIGVMTVCAVEPPTNAFRPGVSAPSKISLWTEDDVDFGLLRNLTAPAAAPSTTTRLALARWPIQTWTVNNDAGRTIGGNNNHANYGPDIASGVATSILLANCNIDSTVKRNLVVAEVQRGIDVYARATQSGNWKNGGGGTGNGRKLSLAFAAHMLGDTAMAAYCDEATHSIWTEDDQIFNVSAGDVAAYDYVAGDLAMPEWRSNAPTFTRVVPNTYREINTIWQPGAALAMMLIGGKTTWAKGAFFDYADRIMERTFYNGSGTNKWATTLTGTNSPPQFHKDMWTNFRSAAGMPAIWNW